MRPTSSIYKNSKFIMNFRVQFNDSFDNYLQFILNELLNYYFFCFAALFLKHQLNISFDKFFLRRFPFDSLWKNVASNNLSELSKTRFGTRRDLNFQSQFNLKMGSNFKFLSRISSGREIPLELFVSANNLNMTKKQINSFESVRSNNKTTKNRIWNSKSKIKNKNSKQKSLTTHVKKKTQKNISRASAFSGCGCRERSPRSFFSSKIPFQPVRQNIKQQMWRSSFLSKFI